MRLGRNYTHMAQKKWVNGNDQMRTHLARMEFPTGVPTNVAYTHSYSMQEEENFLFRSINGRGPKGSEMENLLDTGAGIFSQASDCNWRGVTTEVIHTRGINLLSDFAPSGLPNPLQQAQLSSQYGCVLKKKKTGEGEITPHDDHGDVHTDERKSIHSKMKKISSEKNGTTNELETIHKLVEDMQNLQLVIKELTGTMVNSAHKGVRNHGDPNTIEQVYPQGGPNKDNTMHDGNDSNRNLCSVDVEKYEEKIANLVHELMNTKLLLAQSETKREEDINEMNRRSAS